MGRLLWQRLGVAYLAQPTGHAPLLWWLTVRATVTQHNLSLLSLAGLPFATKL